MTTQLRTHRETDAPFIMISKTFNAGFMILRVSKLTNNVVLAKNLKISFHLKITSWLKAEGAGVPWLKSLMTQKWLWGQQSSKILLQIRRSRGVTSHAWNGTSKIEQNLTREIMSVANLTSSIMESQCAHFTIRKLYRTPKSWVSPRKTRLPQNST